jgi:Holliday junction DNA helicase RuvA
MMIGRLRGIILEKQPPELLIETAGVAYEVQASMQTFYQLPLNNQEIILYTHLIIREDAHQLYGFYTKAERSLFRALLKVNGVGPRMALTILSSSAPEEFIRCVNQGDTASLVRLPGIGKKTAERLIIEMRDRVNGDEFILPSASSPGSAHQDAVSALVALGYKPQEAARALQNIVTENQSSEMLIRLALKKMQAA